MNYEGAMRVVCVARLCAKRLPYSVLAEGRKIESVTRGPKYGRGWGWGWAEDKDDDVPKHTDM